ncbi:MAG: hypothetical protein ABSG43_21575 [Solirubrobacteraceae bacterium]
MSTRTGPVKQFAPWSRPLRLRRCTAIRDDDFDVPQAADDGDSQF